MKRRLLDLRGETPPLLDVVSYGRAGRKPTPAQRQHIALTVRRVPEVMVKVSGGARTLAGVERHMDYIGRDGELGLETDMGNRVGGKGFERSLIEDWDLDVEALKRQSERSIQGRKPPKLVHNIIFSMPPGTSPQKVLQAVRKLALNEWQLKHRYAMTLHTDDKHPHVHVVVKAMSEQGVRLNIRKATLRSWRVQFAANLRELGVAANATERAARGQTRIRKSDGIYRADERGASTHMNARRESVTRELATGGLRPEAASAALQSTRERVVDAWRRVGDLFAAHGDRELSEEIRSFAKQMPPPKTDKQLLAEELGGQTRPHDVDPPDRTR